MPAPPCPKCARPVQAGKPTCFYCGAPLASGPSGEPERLDSGDAVKRVIQMAVAAHEAGRSAECARLMTRVFRELGPGDQAAILENAAVAWLRSLVGRLHADTAAWAEQSLKSAAGLLRSGNAAGARDILRGVLAGNKDEPQHPLLPLCLIGLNAAGQDAPKPAAAPSPQDMQRAFLAALEHCKAERFDEAGRTVTTLFTALSGEDLKTVLESSAEAWLESLKGKVPEAFLAAAKLVLFQVAARAGAGDVGKAHELLQTLMKDAGEHAAHHMLLPLCLMGLKGLAAAGTRAAAPKPPPAPAPGPRILPGEPDKLRSIDDIKAMLDLAWKRCQEGDVPGGKRLMTRLFDEIAVDDLRQLLTLSGEKWLTSMKGHLPEGFFPRAQAALAAAAERLAASDFDAAHKLAAPLLLEAKAAAEFAHHLLPLCALGLKGAVDGRREAARDADYSSLTKAAADALASGRQEEGVRLLEQAIALLPDPPVSERDKTRFSRVRGLLDVYRKEKPPPQGGANQGDAGSAGFV